MATSPERNPFQPQELQTTLHEDAILAKPIGLPPREVDPSQRLICPWLGSDAGQSPSETCRAAVSGTVWFYGLAAVCFQTALVGPLERPWGHPADLGVAWCPALSQHKKPFCLCTGLLSQRRSLPTAEDSSVSCSSARPSPWSRDVYFCSCSW